MLDFQRLIADGDKEGAMNWIDATFDSDPFSADAIFAFACLMVESSHPGPAVFILKALAEKHPNSAAAWQNLCRAYEEFDMPDEAIHAIKNAYKLKPESVQIIGGMGCAYTKAQQWDKAIEWSEKRLAIDDDVQAHVNTGFAKLCTGEYGEGWDGYNRGIGFMTWRAKHDYGMPEWAGEDGAKVVFYKEQGLGDQIAFLSCLPDAIRDEIVGCVAVHEKLVNLYRGSFDIPIYADAPGQVDITGCTHQAPMSVLPQLYRRESFPGLPYLKTNKSKAVQWRALLDSLPGKMKIGIAWNGGSKNSAGFRHRSVDVEAFAPLFDLDADIISLEYKPEDVKGLPIHCYPWGTQTDDYSDTAALISCLDAVVCVPTTAYHLAGALGVPAYVWTPDRPHFHEFLPWWNSVEFIPRTESMDSIQRKLHADFHRSGRAPATSLHSPTIEHRASCLEAGSDYPVTVEPTAHLAAGAY